MEASTVMAGAKVLGTKALVFMTTPVFGVIGLAGVIGWQYFAGIKDEKELKEKKAED